MPAPQSKPTEALPSDEAPSLTVTPATVCFIILKAREFDAKDVVNDPDDASNAADDSMISVLEDHPDDPVLEELTSVISDLSEDAQIARRPRVAGPGRQHHRGLADVAPGVRARTSPTAGARPTISWACRSWAITWRKACRSSVFPAMRSKAGGADLEGGAGRVRAMPHSAPPRRGTAISE